MIKTFLSVIIFSCFIAAAAAQKPATMTIKVFFHNEKQNPNQEDCRKVFPTERTIPKTPAVARAALDEFLKGMTEEERKREFWSFSPEETKDVVLKLNVKNGAAYLNFNKSVYEKLGSATTSCGGGFFPGLEATLTQFPTIKNVYYAIEGNANEFYDWVQVGECPHGKKHCSSKNFQ